MQVLKCNLLPRCAILLLPRAFCLLISLFPPLFAEHPAEVRDPARAVVQLLAIGPGAGEKKQECAATGFLISPEGHILTNAHVVEDARRCLAASPGERILAKFGPGDGRTAEAVAVDVVAVDDERDLALLKTVSPLPESQRNDYLRLERKAPLAGTQVRVTGYPSFVWQPKTYSGRVINRQSMALGDKRAGRTGVIILDISLKRGASGSPVYLESGEVVGIVERQNPSNRLATVAIEASEAAKWLEGLGFHCP